jgi:hypothetical protein
MTSVVSANFFPLNATGGGLSFPVATRPEETCTSTCLYTRVGNLLTCFRANVGNPMKPLPWGHVQIITQTERKGGSILPMDSIILQQVKVLRLPLLQANVDLRKLGMVRLQPMFQMDCGLPLK